MSDFNYTQTVKRVTVREVGAARLERDYVALVQHFNLTHDTDSKTLTSAARTVVMDGAAADGKTITEADLTGRDPGADCKTRDYWKAARAVRIGLVNAMGDKIKGDTDWIKLVRQAAENAHNKGEFSADCILDHVREALGQDSDEEHAA